MEIGNYLKQYQEVAYKIFLNAVEKNKISHAYLLVSEKGIPSKEIALFFAKTLVCDNPNPLACEHCLTCLRVDDGNYADIKILGNDGTIKKSDVENVTETFTHTPIESKGKLIYIIHLVENMNDSAVNALLKFLEEPGKETYAILTTENESKVLPTIISRTQRIRLRMVRKEIIIEEATKIGVPSEDAELLANFYNNSELIEAKYKDEHYNILKEALLKLLNAILENKFKAMFVLQSEIEPLISKKEDAKTFLDMLTVAFQDLANMKIGKEIILKSYDTILRQLNDILKNIDVSLLNIMTARTQIDLNLNVPLLMDKIMIQILSEE